MKPKNIKKFVFINNYIISPLYILIMFWLFFFKGDAFSLEKIVNQKHNPRMYLALLFAILGFIILRWSIKFPRDSQK